MLKAGIWAVIDQVGQQLVGLLIVVVLARILTPGEYGVVAAAQVVLVLAQVVVDFGIGATLVQTPHLTVQLERTAFTIMVGFALVVAAMIGLATPGLARFMNAPELVDVLPVMLVTFIFASINNPSLSLLTRDMRFRLIAGIDLFAMAFVQAVVAVSLALMGWSYWSVILSMLAGTVTKTLLTHYFRPIRPTLQIRWDDVKLLGTFGMGMFLSNLFAQMAQRVDNVVVSSTMGLTPLGYYNRAYKLMDLSNSLLGSAFRSILFAGFSKKRREKSIGISRGEAFLIAQVFTMLVAVPMAAAMLVLAPEIISIVLGPQWHDVVPLLQIFAAGMIFRLGAKVSHSFNLAEGAVYRTAIRYAFFAALVGIGAWIGSRFGLQWVAILVLVALAVQWLSLTQMAARACGLAASQLVVAVFPVLSIGLLATVLSDAIALELRAEEAPMILTIAAAGVAFALPYAGGLWLLRKQPLLKAIQVRLRGLLVRVKAV